MKWKASFSTIAIFLFASISHAASLEKVVKGRCHMGVCWWWKVEKIENVKAEKTRRLVRVYGKTTEVEFSEREMKKHGYPNSPPRQSQWEEIGETYIFCSKRLPTYIVYDEGTKQFTGTIPFDPSGNSLGATEGVGNLYYSICGKKSKFEMNHKIEGMILEKPTDIFDYYDGTP